MPLYKVTSKSFPQYHSDESTLYLPVNVELHKIGDHYDEIVG